MADEALTALGLELRGRAEAWLGGLLAGWEVAGPREAEEVVRALSLVEGDVDRLAREVESLNRLEAALTAGFFPAPPAAAPRPGTEDEDDEGGAEDRLHRSVYDLTRQDGGSSPVAGRDSRPNEPVSPLRKAVRPDAPPPPRLVASPDHASGSADGDDRGRAADAGDTRRADRSAEADAAPDREPADDDGEAPNVRREVPGDAGQWSGDFGRPPVGVTPRDAAPAPMSRDGAYPQTGGGIRGLGDLASLAGLGGLELAEDAGRSTPPSWLPEAHLPEPEGEADRLAGSQDVLRGDVLRPLPGAVQSTPPDVDRTADAASVASPAPTRAGPEIVIRRPSSEPRGSDPVIPDPAADADDVRSSAVDGGGWSDGLRAVDGRDLILPFLRTPGQPAVEDEEPDSGASAYRTEPADAAGWPGVTHRRSESVSAERDPTASAADDGLLRAVGRLVGRGPYPPPLPAGAESPPIRAAAAPRELAAESAPRLQASTEWPTPAPEPAARTEDGPGAGPEPLPRAPDDETVPAVVRGVEAAPAPPAGPPGWTEPDVQDLLDALAREIEHEYRRHYVA